MDMLLTSLDWNNISSSIESLSRMKKWLSTAKAVRKLLSMPEVDKLNSFIFAGPDWLKVAKDNPSAILAMTEAISVLGNCCFLESEMSIFVKNHKLLAVVVNLVQLAGKLDPNFFASVLRCLGNLALRKECAVGILQSPYHAVDTIIERMASSETSLKVQNLSLRFLSSFTLNGLSFASFLLKKRAVSALGKMFLSPTSTDAMKEKILSILNTFAYCGGIDLANQLHQVELLPSLMTLLNEAELSRSRELAEKLFDKLSSISTLKVELVKLGALEFLTHQIAMNESNPIKRQSYLFLLTKYCDHAYCRVKIREANVIPVLVAEFLNAPPCSEVTWRLAKAFQCFLHDPPGLKLMLDSDRFIPGLFQQIRHYIQTNKCPHPIPKTHVKPAAEEDMAKSLVNDKATETDMVRPESPTYTAIAQEQMESQRECSLNLSGPLCKNFTEDFTSVQQFPSSSPGPSWSPSYTSGSFASMSPRSLSSPSMSPGRDGTYGDLTDYPVSFSPSIISEWTKADGMSPSTELLEESETRKRSNNEMISEPPVKRLCTENTGSTVEITRVCACLTPPANSGEVDYAKSTLAAVMDFISYWSNNETFSNCLMKTDVVETLVNYIRLCCDPYRKSLRILVRVVQDPRHREELLAMEFHRLVKRNLCFNTRNSVKLCPVNKTVSRAECWRCQRNCKLGCTAFNEFQMSADDNDYLKGILAHQLMSKSPEDTVKAAVAAGFIVRNENRKYRLMVDYKALNVLMDFILGTISLPREDSEMKADSIDALCQTLNRSLLESELRNATDLNWPSPTECSYDVFMVNETDLVSFVSADKEETPVLMSRTQLVDISPVYAAMLSGDFCEARQESLNLTQSRDTFLYFLHFLCGCRNCPTMRDVRLNDFDVLQLIDMSNLHLIPKLADDLVARHVRRVINEQNAINFLTTGVIHQNVKLQRLAFASAMLSLTDLDQTGEKLVEFLTQLAESGYFANFIEIFRQFIR